MEIFLRKHGNGNKRQPLEEDEDKKNVARTQSENDKGN
jgi:hypothetical protein